MNLFNWIQFFSKLKSKPMAKQDKTTTTPDATVSTFSPVAEQMIEALTASDNASVKQICNLYESSLVNSDARVRLQNYYSKHGTAYVLAIFAGDLKTASGLASIEDKKLLAGIK